MAYRPWIAAVGKVAAGHDGIHRGHQVGIPRHAKQCRIIAHSKLDVGPRSADVREEATDQFEFPERRVLLSHDA